MWIAITLLCAFFFATSDALSKAALRKTPPLALAFARYATSAAFMSVFLFRSAPPPHPGEYLGWFALALPLEICAIVLYMKALSRSPLSLTVPFLALTPVAVIFVGWLFLGERPRAAGMGGVALVAAGAYVLALRKNAAGLLDPFRTLSREPGSLMMMAVALLYSVTATAGKKMVLLSSPFFMASSYSLVLAAALAVALFVRQGGRFSRGYSAAPSFGPSGFRKRATR